MIQSEQLAVPDEPPERRALLLLLSALELARHAVGEQHPRLAHLPLDSPPSLPASELLAEILIERSAELSHWIHRYNRAIDHMLHDRFGPF